MRRAAPERPVPPARKSLAFGHPGVLGGVFLLGLCWQTQCRCSRGRQAVESMQSLAWWGSRHGSQIIGQSSHLARAAAASAICRVHVSACPASSSAGPSYGPLSVMCSPQVEQLQ